MMKLFSKLFRQFEQSMLLRPSTLLILGTLFFIFISKTTPSFKSAGIIALFIAAFFLGEKLGIKKFSPKIKISQQKIYYFGISLFLISLTAIYLTIVTSGGIPLLNASIRRFMNPLLTYMSFLIVPASVLLMATLSGKKHAKIYAISLIAISTALVSLLGFRTEILAALIAGVLTAYYSKIFSAKEIIAFALIAIFAFLGATYLRENNFDSSRAATTLSAFNFLAEKTPALGLTHGYVEFADFIKFLTDIPMYGGRTLVSSVLGGRVSVSMTSTLYGPPYIDFGILGSLVFLFFGVVLGAGYKAVKKGSVFAAAHSFLLTFLLLGIETGIVDLIVWAYFIFISLFYLIAHNHGP